MIYGPQGFAWEKPFTLDYGHFKLEDCYNVFDIINGLATQLNTEISNRIAEDDSLDQAKAGTDVTDALNTRINDDVIPYIINGIEVLATRVGGAVTIAVSGKRDDAALFAGADSFSLNNN